MDTTMTRAEREAFLADVHVGVLSIAEPGRGPRERRGARDVSGAEHR
jgi:hypothetical protein